MGKLKDLTGNVYGRLTVISRAPDKLYENGRRKSFWNCLCSCGEPKIIAGDNLKQGDTKSCGCFNMEVLKAKADPLRKEFPMEWQSHRGMIDRVSRVAKYKELGMCESWRDFSVFLSDMGCRPSKQHTIDRIDTKAGYCPSNCRWADKSTQAYNSKLPSNNNTGRVGVSPLRGKYQAYISYEGVNIYLGVFEEIQDAIDARVKAEIKYYGYTPNH